MPAISKIRFTNVIYENGGKRYNDDVFQFDGYNGAIVLENGGGKTVFVQTALQAILPHYNMEERKIRDTLSLEGNPCHIAIEWILNDRPRKYLVTAVTLFLTNNKLDSYRYVYEYSFDDDHNIDNIPFVKDAQGGNKRPASKGEIADYYQYMQSRSMNAKLFKTIGEYHEYIEENYKIIPSEWKSVARINDAEGGVEGYFENCKTTGQLVDRLLIPVVEEAISENGTKDFARTFEEQRERFKKHRQLRERIEESKEIAKQVDRYVNFFTDYHNVDKDFTHEKQYSKALYLYIKNEEVNLEKNINRNQLDKQETQNLYRELKRKEISYDLSILREKLNDATRELKEAENLFTELRHDYDNKNARLNSLNIAKLKQEIKEAEDSISSYEEQIKVLESEIDIEEIKDKLEENSSKLRSSFMNEEEELNKEKAALVNAEGTAREEYDKEVKKLKDLQATKEDVINEMNHKNGQKSEKENSLKKARDKIVGLDPNEDIKVQQQLWIAKVGSLEKANVESNKLIRELESEKIDVATKLIVDRQNFSDLGRKQAVINSKINDLEETQNKLLLDIKQLNDSWYHVDSLYSRQDSIISYMSSKVENLIKEKENLLLEERISGRFKDDYEERSYFTPEPLLEKWIALWRNQFKYIETGAQYIQRAANALGIREGEFLSIYPFWSISIVVEDAEVEMLKDRLFNNIEKITSPILILGQEEALKLVKEGKTVKELVIMPKYWTENMNQEFFKNWKLEVKKKFEEIIEKRKLKEKEIGLYTECLRKLREFFSQYSYDYYNELKEKRMTIEKSYEYLEREIKNKENRLEEIHREISRQNQQINNNKDEINSLNQWIESAQEYIICQREIEEITAVLHQLNDKDRRLEIEFNYLSRQISRKEDILGNLKDTIEEFARRINLLLEDPLYKEVKNAMPIFINTSRSSLIEERKNLKDILSEKQGDIGKYYEFINNEEKRKNKSIKELKQARQQSDYPIDEELIFPSYGEEEIDKLIEEIERMKPIKKRLENIFKEKESQYEKTSAMYEAEEKQFYKEFVEIIIFKDALNNVKVLLDKEKMELNQREKRNIETYNKLLKEKELITSLIEDIKMKNEKYEYLSDSIEPSSLEADFHRDFPYSRIEFVSRALKSLEELQSKLKESKDNLEDQKSKFISFCNDKIKDPRLRGITVSGVKQKTNYEEVLDWQSKMKTSIETTIRIAEDDIREHDKDLEQFINHLCTYLKTLTDELSIIPKKTRIKVEDKWREVYQFNIPEWKEEEGKEEIRKHVDWMIRQLDHSEFKNEDGTDNNGKITKEIEKWLDSKQLLPIVLKNNQIKVSCRKVTNDGKISGGLNSWESSNRWSGGEKWSKNMTLFLGILNYVAEKRQGIIAGLKTNRTVIVDNPFGKASSDHVLDPVFFIAEKLGFQIIALTAHTEGSFIRNYFPVVYSCRLRESVNNSSLIIDKEKEIQYAFFRDKDPEALNRLEEKRQLTLFG